VGKEFLFPLPLTPGSCGSCGPRSAPTRSGGTGGRAAGTPFEAAGQHMGEFLIRHASGLLPESFHQTCLLVGEVIAVPGEGVVKVLPCLLQKDRVRHCPACQVPQYVLAHEYLPRVRCPYARV
jgi:hypothetical protein